MKQQEIFWLTAIGLLVSSKDVLASEKFDYVRLATLERDNRVSSWLISKVISLPPVRVERSVRPSLPGAEPTSLTQFKNRTYTIASGDTLENLAKKFQTTVSQLVSSNGIENPNYIVVGQTLMIPEPSQNRSTASVEAFNQPTQNRKAPTPEPISLKEIDVSDLVKREKKFLLPPPPPPRRTEPKNFSSKQMFAPTRLTERQTNLGRIRRSSRPITFGRSYKSLHRTSSGQELVYVAPTDSNSQFSIRQVPPQQPPLEVPDNHLPLSPMKITGYIWPTSGTLTSGYGWRWGRMHKGVDIANAIGTPIWAAADGEVISAGWNNGGYGNLVKLKHADGSVTLYAHNSRILVYEGQRVEQGELIAQMGSTGRSTGSHLHFEIHPSGEGAVNPMAYLPK
jgi:murein DD-endopeptidase MepM/ murein hydrolase activator NlpD